MPRAIFGIREVNTKIASSIVATSGVVTTEAKTNPPNPAMTWYKTQNQYSDTDARPLKFA